MLYTRKEFAEKLGISFETLRSWERKGLITPLRTPTNRPFYNDEKYSEYIAKCDERGTANEN